jgi:hypothetical protein
MFISSLRHMTAKERTVYLGGTLLAIASVIAVFIISGWKHRRLIAPECASDLWFNSATCTDATSLTHLNGWINWALPSSRR